jgi:CRP/FNR family transcriptional regulator
MLFREGDPVIGVFTLTRGKVKLYKHLPDGHRQILGVFGSGDFLGVSMGDEHVFSAEALEDSELCCFPRDAFDQFVDEHPTMQQELYRMAAREFAVAELQLLYAGRKTAAERLAGFLLFLLERTPGVNNEESNVVTLPMRHVDIADLLGLTRETVKRILSAFWAARLIRLRDVRRVEILDRSTIQQLARSEYND